MHEFNPPRCTDWQARLDQHVLENLSVPFAWDGQNCTTFAARWVELATGRTLDVPVTRTARGAALKVKALKGLQAEAARQLGEPAPGLLAQCGDVVLIKLPGEEGTGGQAFGVCLGSSIAAQGVAGLVMIPITEAVVAWRV